MLWEPFKLQRQLVQLLAIRKQIANGAHRSVSSLLFITSVDSGFVSVCNGVMNILDPECCYSLKVTALWTLLDIGNSGVNPPRYWQQRYEPSTNWQQLYKPCVSSKRTGNSVLPAFPRVEEGGGGSAPCGNNPFHLQESVLQPVLWLPLNGIPGVHHLRQKVLVESWNSQLEQIPPPHSPGDI